MRLPKLLLIATSAFAISTAAQADTTIAYPTTDNTLFTVTSPEDWKLTPAESDDDYFIIQGPTGAQLYFRAMPGKIEETINENIEYLKENFTDVEIGDPKEYEEDGLAALTATGKGKNKEDGTAVVFGMAWVVLPSGKVAEIWFETSADDAEGSKAAQKILSSFTPKK